METLYAEHDGGDSNLYIELDVMGVDKAPSIRFSCLRIVRSRILDHALVEIETHAQSRLQVTLTEEKISLTSAAAKINENFTLRNIADDFSHIPVKILLTPRLGETRPLLIVIPEVHVA